MQTKNELIDRKILDDGEIILYVAECSFNLLKALSDMRVLQKADGAELYSQAKLNSIDIFEPEEVENLFGWVH